MRHDLDGAQAHRQVHHALQRQGKAQQPDQHQRALGGPEDQRDAYGSGDDGHREDQPPCAQPEAAGIHGGLNLEQAVGHDLDAQYDAQHVHRTPGSDDQRQAQCDQQRAEGQVELEGQPVQILGEIAHQLYRAEGDQHRADDVADQRDRHAGVCHQRDAQAAQYRGQADVARLGRLDDLCGTHMSLPPGFQSLMPSMLRRSMISVAPCRSAHSLWMRASASSSMPSFSQSTIMPKHSHL